MQGECSVLLSDEVIELAGRVYVKATATLVFSGETASCTAMARESLSKKGMDESQITGSASSYARKYALNGLFAIDDTKDADSRDNSKSEPAHKKSTLMDLFADGSEFEIAQYWRSMTQEEQESDWRALDKDSQKALKKLLQEIPAK